jgi:hypothetical protein
LKLWPSLLACHPPTTSAQWFPNQERPFARGSGLVARGVSTENLKRKEV